MQVCNNLTTGEIDDHRIQSDYKCTSELQNPEGKNSECLVLRLRGETEHDTTDNVTTKTQSTFHTAHMNFNTSIGARVIPCSHSPVVRFWSFWIADNIAWLKFHLCASFHGHHMMSVFLRFSVLHSFFTSSSSHSSLTSCTSSCTSSTLPWGQ